MFHVIVNKFIILLLIPICFGIGEVTLSTQQIRSQLEKAPFDESVAESLLFELRQMEDKDALHTAFLASAEGIMCLHTDGVIKKMKYANNAVEIANTAVKMDNKDFEIRFIRFTIQSQIPKILGKSHDLKSDKEYLIKHFNQESLSNIPFRNIEEMVHVLEESGHFSASEILKMRAVLYTFENH